MKRAILYIHGRGGSASEAEHYKLLFPGEDVMGLEYQANTPWEAAREFSQRYEELTKDHDEIMLIANSIGAFFCMSTPVDPRIKRAFFISPIVNMERLITDMMQWAAVSEEELKEKQEITTPFGETLSWKYLCYVREHPISWQIPTHILYGDRDNLTSLTTVTDFAKGTGATLTVMDGGEHWFHTSEQMNFLDRWLMAYR